MTCSGCSVTPANNVGLVIKASGTGDQVTPCAADDADAMGVIVGYEGTTEYIIANSGVAWVLIYALGSGAVVGNWLKPAGVGKATPVGVSYTGMIIGQVLQLDGGTGADSAKVALNFYTIGGGAADDDWEINGDGTSPDTVYNLNDYVGIGTATPLALLEVANADALVYGLTVGKGPGEEPCNTALGMEVLNSNTSGDNNTAVGYIALHSAVSAHYNTAVGSKALYSNIRDNNTAVGFMALYNSTYGYNTAVGAYSLGGNSRGTYNTAVGYQALDGNSTGGYNSAFGTQALYSVLGGRSENTAIGYKAGTGSIALDGSDNTFLGANTTYTAPGWGLTNATAVGAGAHVAKCNTVILGNGADVGIGTSMPLAQLHTTGSVRFAGAGTPTAGYVLTATDASGNATWQAGVGGSGDTDWTGAGTGSMYATSTLDKVGIGTSGPTAKLHVIGADGCSSSDPPTAAPTAVILQGGVGGASVVVGKTGGSIQITGGTGGTGSLVCGAGGDILISGGESGGGTAVEGNVLLAAKIGYVGIGTPGPTGILHVEGGTAADNVSGTHINISAQDGGAAVTTAATNGGNILLLPGDGVDKGDSGRVGIGEEKPDATCTINGSWAMRITEVTANYSTTRTDVILHVKPILAHVLTITLSTLDCNDGRIIIIKDATGDAGTNTINICTEGTETIDGSSADPPLSITTNYGARAVYSDGSNWFKFSGN